MELCGGLKTNNQPETQDGEAVRPISLCIAVVSLYNHGTSE
jgi:hypothetical protein